MNTVELKGENEEGEQKLRNLSEVASLNCITSMAGFAGNIICFKFSSRVFSTPFIKNRSIWKSRITCLKKRRDFSPSVPNTCSKVKKKIPETTASVQEINMNGRKHVHHGRRFAHFESSSQNLNEIQNNLVFEDNEEGIKQMEEVAEAVEELSIHQEGAGDSCEQDIIHIDRFTNDVEESAIKLLAARLVVVPQ
ncbi:hypothetical protein RIF29_18143 [Crotalaria pallida]|uniref:Uncharacterized protein n=1 Tax=Crotalaria pallida TaxID=3830 RepID=A0AAN9FJU9_CROPI